MSWSGGILFNDLCLKIKIHLTDYDFKIIDFHYT